MDARVVHTAPHGLAGRLRDATLTLHAEAERAGCMPALLRGSLPLADYVQLLQHLRALYAALEAALQRHASHPCIAPLPLAALARHASLTRDLDTLAPGAPEPDLVPAGRAYVQRLEQLDADAPALLVAHAYVRYLGDLSGGQALARIVARSHGLQAGEGTAFYDFGPSPGAVAHALRAALAALPLDAAASSALVAEAQTAFARHVELFEQLAARSQASSSPDSCS